MNIIGFNSPEWFVSNFGAIAARGIAAGIYTTNKPASCAYITKDCEASVIVVDGQKQLQKYLGIRDDKVEFKGVMDSVKCIVVYNMDEDEVTYFVDKRCIFLFPS